MMEIGGMEQPGRVPPHQIYAVDTETVFEANYIDPGSETLSGVEYETCPTVGSARFEGTEHLHICSFVVFGL